MQHGVLPVVGFVTRDASGLDELLFLCRQWRPMYIVKFLLRASM